MSVSLYACMSGLPHPSPQSALRRSAAASPSPTPTFSMLTAMSSRPAPCARATWPQPLCPPARTTGSAQSATLHLRCVLLLTHTHTLSLSCFLCIDPSNTCNQHIHTTHSHISLQTMRLLPCQHLVCDACATAAEHASACCICKQN